MTNTERLNAYVASLLVWNVKLHNLHWNVTGKLFKPLHEYTEALYDKAFEAYDEVAELLKMKGEMPHATLRGSVELSVVEEVAPRLFSSCEVVAEVEADMKKMAKLAREIRDAAGAGYSLTTSRRRASLRATSRATPRNSGSSPPCVRMPGRKAAARRRPDNSPSVRSDRTD